jgi:hypothetical protein
LYVGADVTKTAAPDSFFAGRIDAVRISSSVRYVGERIDAPRQPGIDAHTVLALDMEGRVGPWLLDGSGGARHAELVGGARVE